MSVRVMRARMPMALGNRVMPRVVTCVMSGVRVSAMRMTSVSMRVAMTVSMATQTTNRHPCEANSAKRECGEIYVH
jgi:hypothetical protein